MISLAGIKTLVLDEVDRMLDMGFIPAIRRIVGQLPRARQTLCFSATLEPSVEHLVDDYARGAVRLAFGSTTKASESVNLLAYEVHADQKLSLLKRLLNEETGRTLIFVRTKRATERLAEKLNRQGLNVSVLHGDRSQSQRNSALTAFQHGKSRVLVATDVASAAFTWTISPRSSTTTCRHTGRLHPSSGPHGKGRSNGLSHHFLFRGRAV